MNVYEKILNLLLEESQKIDIPDESMISKGFVIENEKGFKYTVKDVIKREGEKTKFIVASNNYEEEFTCEEIKKIYKRA